MHFFPIHVLQAWHFTLRSTAKVLVLSFLLLVGLFSSPLFVQPEEIDAHKKDIVSITEKETKIISELENLNFGLNDARQTVFLIRKDILKIDQLINENTRRSRAFSKKIIINEKYASQRIVALYKLNQLGKFNLLASTDSIYDLFHRKIKSHWKKSCIRMKLFLKCCRRTRTSFLWFAGTWMPRKRKKMLSKND